MEEGNEKGINVPMKMRPHCSRNYSTICCCEDEAITKVLFLLIDSQSYQKFTLNSYISFFFLLVGGRN